MSATNTFKTGTVTATSGAANPNRNRKKALMANRRKNILFIKAGSFSNINDALFRVFETQFPEYRTVIVDIHDVLRRHKAVLLTNLLHTIGCFGLRAAWAVTRKDRFLWYFFSTPYLFHAVRMLVNDHIESMQPADFVFSLQTQTTFDLSLEGLPHFIYTDNVEIANDYIPGFRNLLPFQRFDLEKLVLRNASKIFTMSSNVQEAIVEHYGCQREKVSCVYAGSNVSAKTADSGQRNYFNKNFLFVGRDFERKGGSILLEAFKLVRKSHPDARLTIVGCSQKLSVPNCNAVGLVPLGEVSKYYEQASVFCLPTFSEPFGIALVEAMTYKLPIVATGIAAIPDFVVEGKSGYLVRPGNVQQLADALIRLLDDPDKCRSFGETGYRIAIDRYTWERVGTRMRESIASVITLQADGG